MPELPEVETTLRGIQPYFDKQTIKQIIIRTPKLRWPVPKNLDTVLKLQKIITMQRRGKYIIISTEPGHIILHLGMSGHLRILNEDTPAEKHDHVDIVLTSGYCCRLTDPRRFGCLLFTDSDPLQHQLLKSLGPEPLSPEFTGEYLYQQTRRRNVNIKQFIMNSHNIVGVGNIYANEALFAAKIHPLRRACQLSKRQSETLATAIKSILAAAIKRGGTTLKNFLTSDGKPGYFKQSLLVYGREGEACVICKKPLTHKFINQRTTVYCTKCQT